MFTPIVLLLWLAVAAPGALGCAHTYTHDGGLPPIHGRTLQEAATTSAQAADSCHYTHIMAGRDWPAHDAACNWTCAGSSQSPINVPKGINAVLDKALAADLRFGTATNLRVLNLGHAVQVEFDAPANGKASVAVLGDSVFNLYNAKNPNRAAVRRINIQPLQFHFHGTSEHLLAGRSTQLEFHLVTKLVPTPGQAMPKECPEGSDKLCLAVFGVMYDLYPTAAPIAGDPFIQKIIDNLPKCDEAGKTCKKDVAGWRLNLRSLLPSGGYQTYTGSLTTPPCSQGVMWHVFPTVKATLSQKQALDLQLALSTIVEDGSVVANRLNNREVQPRNKRNVFAASA